MAKALLDANFIGILLSDTSRIPADPNTGQPYERAKERIEFLVERLQAANTKILIPTPALAEFLVLARSDGGKYLSELHGLYRFEIEDFDEMAAIELADLAIRDGKPSRAKRGEETWAKLKYDRQIIAIAKARKADVIYSTDGPLRTLAKRHGLDAYTISDLSLPPPKQAPLFEGSNVTRIDEKASIQETKRSGQNEERQESEDSTQSSSAEL